MLGISVFSIVLSLIIAFSDGVKHRWSLFLSGFIFIFTLYGIAHYFSAVDFKAEYAAFFINHFTPLYLLLGPFLYFYLRGVILDEFRLKASDLWHFIPALLQLVLIWNYIFMPFQEKVELMAQLYANTIDIEHVKFNILFPHKVNNLLRITLLLGYLFYNLLLILGVFGYRDKGNMIYSKYRKSRVYCWLLYFHVIVLIVVLSYSIFMYQYVKDASSLNSSTSHFILFIASVGILSMNILILAFPEVLYGLPRFSIASDINTKDTPSEIDIFPDKPALGHNFEDDYLEKLEEQVTIHFKEKSPYTEHDFCLHDLAVTLGVPKHHLAICFKEQMKIRFVDFRNEFRVSHALTLLKDQGNNYSIEAIGELSGFRSRTSFYNNFKKIMGKNPTDFLQA